VLVGRRLPVPAEPPLVGLKRQLQIYQWHDRWGLEAAERAGTSAEALALLRAYQQAEGPPPEWLGPLKLADDRG